MGEFEKCLETVFNSALGNFKLSRHSRSNSAQEQTLRPWDAADELLLAHLAESKPSLQQRVLIVNDQYGALVAALSGSYDKLPVTFVSDSHLSMQAAKLNLADNGRTDASVQWRTSLDEVTGKVDLILLKLPKSLALLEDQLYRYRSLCHENTQIIAAGMVKHMAAGVFKLFGKILGPTHTSLAQKKARLIFCKPLFCKTQLSGKTDQSPYPLSYVLENTAYQIDNHANVFSAQSLDIGTRFFLQHLPAVEGDVNIADLGCGNGVVGLIAAQINPQAQIDFYDESFMAVASAKLNFTRAFPGRVARFIADDSMASALENYYQAVLCNPPFHQHNVVGDFVALQMFRDARRALKAGGELWVIGNRHLGYAERLKRLFGNCVLVAQNSKFVIVRSEKS